MNLYVGCRNDASGGCLSGFLAGNSINFVSGSNPNTVFATQAVSSPGQGKWGFLPLTFTPGVGDASIGQTHGIGLFAVADINHEVDWDDVTLTKSGIHWRHKSCYQQTYKIAPLILAVSISVQSLHTRR